MRSLTYVAVAVLLASLFGSVVRPVEDRLQAAGVLMMKPPAPCAPDTLDDILATDRDLEQRKWKIELRAWGLELKLVGTWPGRAAPPARAASLRQIP